MSQEEDAPPPRPTYGLLGPPPDDLMSLEEVAEKLGTTVRRVTQLSRDAMPYGYFVNIEGLSLSEANSLILRAPRFYSLAELKRLLEESRRKQRERSKARREAAANV